MIAKKESSYKNSNLYTAHTVGLKWTSLTREASNRTASKIERID